MKYPIMATGLAALGRLVRMEKDNSHQGRCLERRSERDRRITTFDLAYRGLRNTGPFGELGDRPPSAFARELDPRTK